ncbi:MAG: T9SS type A sorting domain-containing protein [Ferruginibacter sp.]
MNVLGYTTGVEANDAPFKTSFPYLATPWAGNHICDCDENDPATSSRKAKIGNAAVFQGLAVAPPEMMATTSPNPFVGRNNLRYHLDEAAQVNIALFDAEGRQIKVLVNKQLKPGTYNQSWNGDDLIKGIYFIKVTKNGVVKQNLKVVKG